MFEPLCNTNIEPIKLFIITISVAYVMKHIS
jgi:hypothetical protein